MPSGGRQRGGVAAATAFYGNKAGGAASAGIKQSKRQRQRAGLSPRAKSSSDMEVGFKSPRAVARWQQHKLAMAGMVTELRPWDDATRPFTKTVSTPAPVPRRDFSKISPYEIQKFEQWHDRHPHLDYPREIPDPMFYHKKGKGVLECFCPRSAVLLPRHLYTHLIVCCRSRLFPLQDRCPRGTTRRRLRKPMAVGMSRSSQASGRHPRAGAHRTRYRTANRIRGAGRRF
jgi:hypothetical protein